MTSWASPADEPLAGFTIGVTAARRSEEFIALLRRRGATVVYAPALRIVPLADDTELHCVTEHIVADPPDVVVVSTGIGFRGWMDAAHGWGVAEDVVAALGAARILTRGPKARGAVRQAGLCEQWSPESETLREVLDRVLADGATGLRIAVQLHGAPAQRGPDVDLGDALTFAGAQVLRVPVYRWAPPRDRRPMDQLIAMIADAGLDAVSFTSAPAVASVLQHADALGCRTQLLAGLRDHVTAACVGPLTAAPLRRLGVPAIHPDRYRLGALARLINDEVPPRARHITAAGHHLCVRSATVAVDGDIRTMPPSAMALLRGLMATPGRVVSRQDLLALLPGAGADTHAVETAMTRLRSALGAPSAVQTVYKRGYRLATDLTAG
ncbi:bifunctional uroporphyrinogen-III synthetase/response regulator domain protein [Mycobacterium gordonae]|uniref:Bifunctional uroporphyrinogen-III synthetase/response regulator domain protein n=1 Tax=Mycobacterium gordonae TaxID=1778 RepID=A0A0Q2LJ70_MYCGO|nr:uroporphyrinogen-III synthase [Mycobacterium gordonae]KQH76281.1 bifunctional uroporphyrinogen-III synthetase/response regulator domain protein [Mycobacterium gordonae]